MGFQRDQNIKNIQLYVSVEPDRRPFEIYLSINNNQPVMCFSRTVSTIALQFFIYHQCHQQAPSFCQFFNQFSAIQQASMSTHLLSCVCSCVPTFHIHPHFSPILFHIASYIRRGVAYLLAIYALVCTANGMRSSPAILATTTSRRISSTRNVLLPSFESFRTFGTLLEPANGTFHCLLLLAENLQLKCRAPAALHMPGHTLVSISSTVGIKRPPSSKLIQWFPAHTSPRVRRQVKVVD